VTTINDLVRDLVAAAPELEALLREHLVDYEELLPHVFFGDVTRWLEERGPAPAVLAVLEHHIGAGDEEVQNVVAVSFLEGLGDEAVRAALGPRLRAELTAMQRWTPDGPEAAT